MSNVLPQSQQLVSFWTKAFEDHLARLAAFEAEVARMQGDANKHAEKQIEEVARLTKESIAYGQELSTAWRTLALSTLRSAADATAAATRG